MKLLCLPRCGNEFASNADLLFLEITPKTARLLLRAHAECRAFLRGLHREGIASSDFGYVSFPSAAEFVVFGARLPWQERIVETLANDRWLCLSDTFAFDPQSDLAARETECHYLLVYETFIILTAVGKNSDEPFQTLDLGVGLLQAIADETEPPGLECVDGRAWVSQEEAS